MLPANSAIVFPGYLSSPFIYVEQKNSIIIILLFLHRKFSLLSENGSAFLSGLVRWNPLTLCVGTKKSLGKENQITPRQLNFVVFPEIAWGKMEILMSQPKLVFSKG